MSLVVAGRVVRYVVVAMACVAVLALMVPVDALAEGLAMDWKAVIKDRRGKDALSVRERFELAIAYANTGDILGAQREFENLERDGWQKEAPAILAESEERLATDPDSVMDLNVVAFASYVLQDYERSCEMFQRVLEADAGNDWPRVYLAWTLGCLGRIDEGIEQLEYMVRKHPFNLILRGLLLYAKSQR